MLQFKSKAQTLHNLCNCITKAFVLDQYSFTVNQWRKNPREILSNIIQIVGEKEVIVRSSALNEDMKEKSNAGHYLSVPDVAIEDIPFAIEQVIASYDNFEEQNEILIQPMLKDVKLFGVVFTQDISTGADYIIINYDESGSTMNLTGGKKDENYISYYYFKHSPIVPPSFLNPVIEMAKELENIYGISALDIEFAIDLSDKLYILQVRPLIEQCKCQLSSKSQCVILDRIYRKIKYEQDTKAYLYGKKTVYSVMSDWNPAEIIGVRPDPLALSLYKELICDEIWARQRDNYGYKNLRGFPLLVNFGGLPYIDVRVCLNSFIPKNLSDNLSERLVEYYMERLINNPHLHDKIEFDIGFFSYSFDMDEKISILLEHGFSLEEIELIKAELLTITNNIITDQNNLFSNDISKINHLQEKRIVIMSSQLDKISKIYWLLEDCKKFGTLPFAGLARSAFVAIALLKSLVAKQVFSQMDYQSFLGNIDSVYSNMLKDLKALSKKKFLKKYGHLRPGAYSITSERYDEAPDKYFYPDGKKENSVKDTNSFSLTLNQMKIIEKMLKECKLSCNIVEFLDFLKMAIEYREYAKFVFTCNLSEALRLFGELAGEEGIDRHEASFANISIIKKCYSSECDFGEEIRKSISEGKERFRATQSLILPPLICNPSEVYSYFSMDNQPNYITLKSVIGDVSTIDQDISEKIVFLPNADPGYNWIFSKNIKGLITMYGGVNSHMAITSNELQIPAVIGTGEKLYDKLVNAERLEIDCLKKTVRVLQ